MKDWTSKQISKFRKINRLTQQQFGELVGVSKTTVYQWERGGRKPSKTAKILMSKIEENFEQKRKGVS